MILGDPCAINSESAHSEEAELKDLLVNEVLMRSV